MRCLLKYVRILWLSVLGELVCLVVAVVYIPYHVYGGGVATIWELVYRPMSLCFITIEEYAR
jgi:hypothetical protein